MSEYDIYDLSSGGREFSPHEQDLVDRGIMPPSQRIKILNEPSDHKREFDSKESPSGYKTNIFNPPQKSFPTQPVQPITSSSNLNQSKSLNNEYKYLSDRIDEMRYEIQNEKLQNERLRNEKLRNEKIYQDLLVHNPRINNDHLLYNKLYNWGVSLMPDYYTYSQRKQLENSLQNLIKSELLLNTPNYVLENLIRKVIEENDSITLNNKNLNISEKKAKSKKKPSSRKKTSSKVSKKTEKSKKSKKSKKSTSKTNKK